MDVESVLGDGRGRGDGKGELGPIRGRDRHGCAGIGEGLQAWRGGEKLGIGLGHELFSDLQFFGPVVVAIFFDFDFVFTGIEIEGVVGGGREFAIDINLGSCGKRVGREKAGPTNGASHGGAVSLSVADHQIRATNYESKSSEKDHKGFGRGVGFSHGLIIAEEVLTWVIRL